MTESALHKLIKNGIATALTNDGFKTNTEYQSEEDGEGRIDFYAKKHDGTVVKVEVVKTNIQKWLLVKIRTKNHRVSSITPTKTKKD